MYFDVECIQIMMKHCFVFNQTRFGKNFGQILFLKSLLKLFRRAHKIKSSKVSIFQGP